MSHVGVDELQKFSLARSHEVRDFPSCLQLGIQSNLYSEVILKPKQVILSLKNLS